MKLIITIEHTDEGWNVQAEEESRDEITFTERIAALAFARHAVESVERKVLERASND